MNGDLISRSGLLKKIRVYADSKVTNEGVETANNILKTVQVIGKMPAVDAAPVVHGRWLPNIREDTRAYPPHTWQNGFKCSLCGRVTRSRKEPYCHCGAKMDLEE